MAMVLIIGAAVCGAGVILGAMDTMQAGTILGSTHGMILGIMAMQAGMVAGTILGIGVDIITLGTGAVR